MHFTTMSVGGLLCPGRPLVPVLWLELYRICDVRITMGKLLKARENLKGEKLGRATKRMLPVLTTVLVLLLGVEVSSAGLRVSPFCIELDLRFGATVVRTVVVTNLGDTSALIETSKRGVRATPTGSLVWLSSEGKDLEGETYSYGALGPLVEIQPNELTLAANSSAEFTIRIDAPEEYLPGAPAGRAGILLFRATPIKQQEAIVRQAFQIATLLLIRFEEHQRPQARLGETEILQQENGKLRFSVLLKNTGNVHLYTDGWITVRDFNTGEMVAELGISTGVSLPQCEREYYAVWRCPEELSGTYEATNHITYEGAPESELVKTCIFELEQGRLKSEVDKGR